MATRPDSNDSTDTIAAIATAAGRGGVGILRVSGPNAAQIGETIAGALPGAREHALRRFRAADASLIDSGLVLHFPAPHSYTGETVVELQAHGGPLIMQLLLEAAVTAGARQARPGEFTERAYLNERMDLLQAEAVADLIDAGSREAARAAVASLQGEFSRRVHAVSDEVMALRTWVEAAIDFSEEELELQSNAELAQRIDTTTDLIDRLCRDAACGRVLREGLAVLIVGRPNVGKSSLLNSLSGSDAAIVTDLPGTTRDLLHSQIMLQGVPLQITDTAGLRDSDDPIEQEGVRRARERFASTELLLLVIEDPKGVTDEDRQLLAGLPPELSRLVVLNKADLSGAACGECETELGSAVRISARTGAGLDILRERLLAQAGQRPGDASPLLARQRHLDALQLAACHLQQAVQLIRVEAALELAAEELKLCQQALGGITGSFSNEDLLGEIFSRFCVGK